MDVILALYLIPPTYPTKQFKEENKLEDLSPAEWWGKIDEVAKENAGKGIALPEMTLDLTQDDFLGVAREEFVKSIKQFLKVRLLPPTHPLTHPLPEKD